MEMRVRVTQNGGITIPAAIRRELQIKAGDAYQLMTDGVNLQFRRIYKKCCICGVNESKVDLIRVKEKYLCEDCASEIKVKRKKGA